ncbi:hypothetical protein [Lysinibacillus sp. G4S2]|uniref:hypothetical protein n=1 Tax=Lysinibacillus sp. G4S2 TaxID=3055859 RepID=UPI0025A0AE5B|nr:hypothetical protein [Lysinibacillus sp. G4S2]MDM5250009.1 hypothetical protein [Lysinibacillus sp. G4S2]
MKRLIGRLLESAQSERKSTTRFGDKPSFFYLCWIKEDHIYINMHLKYSVVKIHLLYAVAYIPLRAPIVFFELKRIDIL